LKGPRRVLGNDNVAVVFLAVGDLFSIVAVLDGDGRAVALCCGSQSQASSVLQRCFVPRTLVARARAGRMNFLKAIVDVITG
jgi:hypothetical protein